MQLSYAITEQIQPWTRLDDIAPIRVNDSRYEVRLAQTMEEMDAALKLRFEVFNLELDEGLASIVFKPGVIVMNSMRLANT